MIKLTIRLRISTYISIYLPLHPKRRKKQQQRRTHLSDFIIHYEQVKIIPYSRKKICEKEEKKLYTIPFHHSMCVYLYNLFCSSSSSSSSSHSSFLSLHIVVLPQQLKIPLSLSIRCDKQLIHPHKLD